MPNIKYYYHWLQFPHDWSLSRHMHAAVISSVSPIVYRGLSRDDRPHARYEAILAAVECHFDFFGLVFFAPLIVYFSRRTSLFDDDFASLASRPERSPSSQRRTACRKQMTAASSPPSRPRCHDDALCRKAAEVSSRH